MVELQPGAAALRDAAPVLASALGTGIEVLPKTPALSRRLNSLLLEVQRFAEDPLVPQGINNTTQLVKALQPTLDYLAPAQTVCNYVTLFFRNVSSLLSEGDRNGTWQRFIIVTTPTGPQQRGQPVVGAGQRADRVQPPAHEPVPEHGVARPAARVRGGQRGVPGRPDGHRQRPDHAAGEDGEVMARKGRRVAKRSNVFIGVVGIAIAAVIMFFGFTKDIPFTHGFRVNAQFESANSIRPNSPVRIAGVQVGKVKAVEGVEGSNARCVVLELDDSALPLHVDASAKIRPRIFLEGNFFVDLKPGSPSAPLMKSGDTIKITQTATPVQLDQVLTSLQSDSREDLQALLDGLNTSLNTKPTPSQDRELPLLARGQTGAESFNDALDDIPAAEKSTARGARGAARHRAQPRRRAADPRHGEHRRRARPQRGRAQGPDHQPQHRRPATFASESANLRASISELPGTLATANRGLHRAQRRVPVDARVRDRDPARRARDAADDRRRVPVDRADAQARRSRTSSAASRRSSRRHRPTWRG